MVDIEAINSKYTNNELRKIVNKVFDFTPSNIFNELKLKDQKYYPLSTYGHFGHKDYPWEEIPEEVIKRLQEVSKSLNGQN